MIYISGNKDYGLAKELSKILPSAKFFSRTNGFDLTKDTDRQRFVDETVDAKVIIICSALWRFQQTILLDAVYKYHETQNTSPLIICIGSTTDRVKKGGAWLYNAEKKALRDYANTLALTGVWGDGPRVSLISFGSLSNVQNKHPNRKCLDIEKAAEFVKWIIDQSEHLHINELSIDPIQKQRNL